MAPLVHGTGKSTNCLGLLASYLQSLVSQILQHVWRSWAKIRIFFNWCWVYERWRNGKSVSGCSEGTPVTYPSQKWHWSCNSRGETPPEVSETEFSEKHLEVSGTNFSILPGSHGGPLRQFLKIFYKTPRGPWNIFGEPPTATPGLRDRFWRFSEKHPGASETDFSIVLGSRRQPLRQFLKIICKKY